MIPRDHGVAPAWVERQELERLDRSLPWRCDPEGSIWQRDPSPRWRVREEWANASLEERDGIMKYKLVMGLDSTYAGVNVHPQPSPRRDEDARSPSTTSILGGSCYELSDPKSVTQPS